MDYKELFNLFKSKNPKLVPLITDYRPAGKMRLNIWFGKFDLTVEYCNERRGFFTIPFILRRL